MSATSLKCFSNSCNVKKYSLLVKLVWQSGKYLTLSIHESACIRIAVSTRQGARCFTVYNISD